MSKTVVKKLHCACGAKMKVVTQIDPKAPTSELVIVCPHCGGEHAVPAERIISIVCDKGETKLY
jgi:hypothetical protein